MQGGQIAPDILEASQITMLNTEKQEAIKMMQHEASLATPVNIDEITEHI